MLSIFYKVRSYPWKCITRLISMINLEATRARSIRNGRARRQNANKFDATFYEINLKKNVIICHWTLETIVIINIYSTTLIIGFPDESSAAQKVGNVRGKLFRDKYSLPPDGFKIMPCVCFVFVFFPRFLQTANARRAWILSWERAPGSRS